MPRVGTPLVNVKAHLPVSESLRFAEPLRHATAGAAFPAMCFDHWAPMPNDPLTPGTAAAAVIAAVRKRKGLREGVPLLSEFEDKLWKKRAARAAWLR